MMAEILTANGLPFKTETPSPSHHNNDSRSENEVTACNAVHQQKAYSFVVDTDSVSVVIDTGANRIIVNDKAILSDFKETKVSVKGLKGSCS